MLFIITDIINAISKKDGKTTLASLKSFSFLGFSYLPVDAMPIILPHCQYQ